MAIVTFAPAGITSDSISEISEVVSPTMTAGAPYELRPPVSFPAPNIVIDPVIVVNPTVTLAPPTFRWPPNQGPVSNIIVEGPTQRGENNFPWNGIALTRQLPPESNPYRMLPENYIMEQWGENLPPQYRTEFYNLERPLDLLRYKSDRYWNVLRYQGGYALNQGEVDIIPFASLTYLGSKGPRKWEIRQGSIITAFEEAHRNQMGATRNYPLGSNFLAVFTKEVIRLEANYNVFSASAPTAPPPPQTWEDARRPTDATNFGERARRELGRGRFRGTGGGGGIGGGGYP